MQGNGNEKFSVLTTKMQDLNISPDVFMLQEVGSRSNPGFILEEEYENYICILTKPNPTATNLHCHICILVKQELKRDFKFEELIKNMDSPVLVMYDEDIAIATMRAITNTSESTAHVKSMLKTFEDWTENKKINSWILIGEFNSEIINYNSDKEFNYEFNHIIPYSGLRVRGGRFECDLVCSKNLSLNPSGNEVVSLDFAFSRNISYSAPLNTSIISNIDIGQGNQNPKIINIKSS